jgi:hypothetical protein
MWRLARAMTAAAAAAATRGAAATAPSARPAAARATAAARPLPVALAAATVAGGCVAAAAAAYAAASPAACAVGDAYTAQELGLAARRGDAAHVQQVRAGGLSPWGQFVAWGEPLTQGSDEYKHIRGHIRIRRLRSIFGVPNMTPTLENIAIFVGIFVGIFVFGF